MDNQIKKINTKDTAKRFLTLFLPILALMFAIISIIIYDLKKEERLTFEHGDMHDTGLQRERIIKDFHLIVSDLTFLSRMAEFPKIINSVDHEAFEEISNEFFVFIKKQENIRPGKIYRQNRHGDNQSQLQ